MKMDGGSKRKLSKRKDPELALSYYNEIGYPVPSVIEYLMTLLNSNFEEWRIANPKEDINKFNFTTKKMSVSGSLFDIDKLRDVSKNVVANMDAETVYNYVLNWSKDYDSELYSLLSENKNYAIEIFSIGRGGKKPRKDIAVWSEVKEYISFFYDSLFNGSYEFPENMNKSLISDVLEEYAKDYKDENDMNEWFNTLCETGGKLGFAKTTKEYKENPEGFKGSPGDVSQIVRVAITGRQNSPDLFTVMSILGYDKVIERLNMAINSL